jgi:hypothetical protein
MQGPIAVPADTIAQWSRDGGPVAAGGRRRTAIRFHWKYRDNDRAGGGRGTARLAVPDSLRLDWAASLGLAAGAAVVIGDSLRWVDPKERFPASVTPAIQLMWTALGMVRPPRPGSELTGLRDSTHLMWRAAADSDTLEYRVTRGSTPMLEAEWRRGGSVMARSRTLLGASGMPASARIDVPKGHARFELTFVGVDSGAVFPATLWRSRR